MGDADHSSRATNNVRVLLRVRPFNERESKETIPILICDYQKNVVMLQKPKDKCTGKDADRKFFQLDYIFSPTSTQLDVFHIAAAPLVDQVFDGYNGTIFAYGQTGSGKTYTMTGTCDAPDQKGIIHNTSNHIFTKIANASKDQSFIVKIMYLEIYNEEVRDLLGVDPNKKLQIKERSDIGIYVKDLTGFTVDSVDTMMQLVERGNENRTTRSTLMNNLSSRSHAVFTIVVETKHRYKNQTTIGKLNLVDLAGSERVKKSGISGIGLRESSSINQSLFTLGNVISALVENKSYVPYRNSKLTRLLQDSLGGNAKTTMIFMVGLSESDYEETYSTLRYAHKAKYIKNFAKVNVEEVRWLIERVENEIAELQEKLLLLSMFSAQPKMSLNKSKSQTDLYKKKAKTKIRLGIDKQEFQDRMALVKKNICSKVLLPQKAKLYEYVITVSDETLERLKKHNHTEHRKK